MESKASPKKIRNAENVTLGVMRKSNFYLIYKDVVVVVVVVVVVIIFANSDGGYSGDGTTIFITIMSLMIASILLADFHVNLHN